MYERKNTFDSSIEEGDSLTHFGVLGMKWGRRKSRPKSSGVKKANKSNKKLSKKEQQAKKMASDIRKQKIKNVAKTTLKIGAAVAATTVLGSVGSMAYREIENLRSENRNLNRTIDINQRTSERMQEISDKYKENGWDNAMENARKIDNTRNVMMKNLNNTSDKNLLEFLYKDTPTINEDIPLILKKNGASRMR